MKARYSFAVVAGTLLISSAIFAQAPAGAPAGTTGKCKDGSYTSQATKQGACRGHKGVDTWYAADAAKEAAPVKEAAPAAASKPAPAPAAQSAPAPASAKTSPAKPSASEKAAAPGGGPGLVWVNTASNVYHCYGSHWYGTTKAGKYETEASAKASGARPDAGHPCSK